MGGKPRGCPGWRNRSERRRSGCSTPTQTACRPRGRSSLGKAWRRRRASRRMRTWRRCLSPLSGKGQRPSRSLPSRCAAISLTCQVPLPAEADFLPPATLVYLSLLSDLAVAKAPAREERHRCCADAQCHRRGHMKGAMPEHITAILALLVGFLFFCYCAREQSVCSLHIIPYPAVCLRLE